MHTHNHTHAQAIAMAETERTINSYVTGISLKLALAAAEWASKFLEYFIPESINLEPKVAIAAAEYHSQSQVCEWGGGVGGEGVGV